MRASAGCWSIEMFAKRPSLLLSYFHLLGCCWTVLSVMGDATIIITISRLLWPHNTPTICISSASGSCADGFGGPPCSISLMKRGSARRTSQYLREKERERERIAGHGRLSLYYSKTCLTTAASKASTRDEDSERGRTFLSLST